MYFAHYYQHYFDSTSTTTHLIPSTTVGNHCNDISETLEDVNDDDDRQSKCDSNAVASETDLSTDDKLLIDRSVRLMATAEFMSESVRQRITNKANKLIEKFKSKQNEIKHKLSRNVSWKKSKKQTIAKLMHAFRVLDCNGILIQSPQYSSDLMQLIVNEWAEHEKSTRFADNCKQGTQICDCIYFHDMLGVYAITVDMTDALENEQIEHVDVNRYELTVTLGQSPVVTVLQTLYTFITRLTTTPKISSITCVLKRSAPNCDVRNNFEKFRQFWTNELSTFDAEKVNLLQHTGYRQFISVMANCSVGRIPFGNKRTIALVNRLSASGFKFKWLNEPLLTANVGMMSTIFLNARQLQILHDKSKYRFVYGAPGTGKTTVLILAAISAAMKSSGRVVVFTRTHLVAYMNEVFLSNGFNGESIRVRDSLIGGVPVHDVEHMFVDDCIANANSIRECIANATTKANDANLLLVLSAEARDDEILSVNEKIIEILSSGYRIYQLNEVVRGTKSIVDFWTHRYDSNVNIYYAHYSKGDIVDHCQCLTSKEVIDTMIDKLRELLINNNAPKSIAIICCGDEEELIRNALSSNEIAFGSTLDQDNDETLIAVASTKNVYSREWPSVIVVSLFPSDARDLALIENSRALTRLICIERDEAEIRKRVRKSTNDRIAAWIDEYERMRSDIALTDSPDIMAYDLLMEIITTNHLPSQIGALFPIFAECNSFDEYLQTIVNGNQWMLLLFVDQWGYYPEAYGLDDSLQLLVKYRQSKYLHRLTTNDANRQRQIDENAKNVVELINKFAQPNVRKEVQTKLPHSDLFEMIVTNSDDRNQLYLMSFAIKQFVRMNSSLQTAENKMQFDMKEIVDWIGDLSINLIPLLLKKYKNVTLQTVHDRK